LTENVESCSNDTVVELSDNQYKLSDNQIMDSDQIINTEMVPRIEKPFVYSSLVDEMKKSKRMEINSRTLGTVALFDPILKGPDDIL
jgi:hypothetical protein